MATDDASFIDFVTARWSSLYRTAFLLTGDDAAAESALLGALSVASCEWSRVRRMEAPETQVRRILVQHAIPGEHRRRTRREAGLGDVAGTALIDVPLDDLALRGIDLWPHLAALTPGQRAVLVLRYAEDLRERDIALALDCSLGAVTAMASDALGTLRSRLAAEVTPGTTEPPDGDGDALERALTDTLWRVAEDATPPAFASDALLARARDNAAERGRRRRLRGGVVAVVAVLVVGALSAIVLHDDESSTAHGPGTPEQTGDGAPPVRVRALVDLPPLPVAVATPYWADGRLHIGAASIAIGEGDVISGHGRGLFAESGAPGDSRVVFVVSGSRLVRLGSALGLVAMSGDGRWAAWESSDVHEQVRLELWDLVTRTMTAHVDFHSKEHCCDDPSGPVGVDAAGRVFVADGARPLVWDHSAGTLRRITGLAPGSEVIGGFADGLVVDVASGTGPGRAIVGSVRADGSFEARGSVPGPLLSISPRGTFAALSGIGGAVRLVRLPSGAAVPLDLPPGADSQGMVWVDDRTVLLAVRDGSPGALVASGPLTWVECDVEAGVCARGSGIAGTAHFGTYDLARAAAGTW